MVQALLLNAGHGVQNFYFGDADHTMYEVHGPKLAYGLTKCRSRVTAALFGPLDSRSARVDVSTASQHCVTRSKAADVPTTEGPARCDLNKIASISDTIEVLLYELQIRRTSAALGIYRTE